MLFHPSCGAHNTLILFEHLHLLLFWGPEDMTAMWLHPVSRQDVSSFAV